MPLGRDVDLGPDDIVLDGEPPQPKGAQQPPLFGPYLLWAQTSGWINMPLGKEVYLGHMDSAPHERRTAPHLFLADVCGQTVAHLSYC